MEEKTTEEDLVLRLLDLIKDGTGDSPYFAYNNLPKDWREKYSIYDIVILFHKLEWNCRIIEVSETYESRVWDPWKEQMMTRKLLRYRLRDEFVAELASKPKELLAKAMNCLNRENITRIH